MSGNLADLQPGDAGSGGVRLWLKSAAYTTRLLLGEAGDPWTGAAPYLAWFSQAHGLLRPDVAVVEVGELYDSWLARHPGLREEMAAKRRLAFPLRKLLESPEPRAVLAEVLEAVVAHLRGQAPLILALPSPRAWLCRANAQIGREGLDFDADAFEDAAMYVADVLRAVSHAAVGGVLLEEAADDRAFGPVEVERYRPLINLARHYRWPLALRLGAAPLAVVPAKEDLDALIGPAGVVAETYCAAGVDVGPAVWSSQALPVLGPRQFYFAEVPRGHPPEQVLESLARGLVFLVGRISEA